MVQPDNGHSNWLNYPCQAPSVSGYALFQLVIFSASPIPKASVTGSLLRFLIAVNTTAERQLTSWGGIANIVEMMSRLSLFPLTAGVNDRGHLVIGLKSMLRLTALSVPSAATGLS